jgi:hypothetical protein
LTPRIGLVVFLSVEKKFHLRDLFSIGLTKPGVEIQNLRTCDDDDVN